MKGTRSIDAVIAMKTMRATNLRELSSAEVAIRRFEWIAENYTSRRVDGLPGFELTIHVPVEHEDLGRAIDITIKREHP